jgi:hypothetical protein
MELTSTGRVFCQATTCLFYNKGKGGTEYIPEEGTNLVTWDHVEGTESNHAIVPNSLWKFNDPHDASRIYLASFGSADISSKTDRFKVKLVGKLWNFGKDTPEDPDEALISSGRTATLLIAGQDGTYDTAAAFVCYREN